MALIKCAECSREISDKARSCPGCGAPVGAAASAPAQVPAAVVPPPTVVSERAAPGGEVTFYTDAKGVRISNTRATISGTTYAMANISSVRLETKNPEYGGAVLLMLMGLIMAVGSFALSRDLIWLSIVGGLLLAGGFIWAVSLKPTYWVQIHAAGGETQPLGSQDRQYIESVVNAMNEAFVHCG